MEVAFVPCPAAVAPTEIRRRQLQARGDAYVVEQSYSCELHAEHEGPHYSIGQSLDPESTSDGDDDVWIRWSNDRDATLEAKPMCAAAHDGGDCGGDGICMLYGGHPGPHTDECETRWL